MTEIAIVSDYMSSFLAVFLTVLVTSPQQRWETQAGLEQPWGVLSSSVSLQQPEESPACGTHGRQGRHPELTGRVATGY